MNKSSVAREKFVREILSYENHLHSIIRPGLKSRAACTKPP